MSTTTLDLTPTWAGILNGLVALIENGNAEGRRQATIELRRMAQAADKYNELTNAMQELKNITEACDQVNDDSYLFTVTANDGEVILAAVKAQEVIDYCNTAMEYDRRDADAAEISDVWIAVRELRKADFIVQVN